jgi:hypothetical protein
MRVLSVKLVLVEVVRNRERFVDWRFGGPPEGSPPIDARAAA